MSYFHKCHTTIRSVGIFCQGDDYYRLWFWKMNSMKDTGSRKILNNEIKYFNLIYAQYTSFFLHFPLYLLTCLHSITNWYSLLSRLLISWICMHTHTHTNIQSHSPNSPSLTHSCKTVSHSNSYIYSHTYNLYTYIWAKSQTITLYVCFCKWLGLEKFN